MLFIKAMRNMDSNKWRTMQLQYRRNLRHKADVLHTLWQSLAKDVNDSALAEIVRLSHQLAGSGAIYGFAEVSRLAHQLHNHLCNTDNAISDIHVQTTLTELINELGNDDAFPDETALNNAFAPAPSENSAKIVFVDDDEDLLHYHSSALKAAGYDVIPLKDITLLAAAVVQHQPLAAICDMAFPEGETAGADYLRQVRQQQGAAFPVLFISAIDNFTNRLAAVRAGSSHYLAKPVCSQKLCQILATLLQKAEQNPYRVMLVDDDNDVLKFYRQALQLAGYQVYCCSDPQQALQQMLQHQPELVLIDLHMPGCHGLELGQIIRQHSELIDTPIVFMSADESIDEKLAAVRLAGDEFIHKPIAPWRLLMVVEARVKRSRLLRQQKRQLMRQPELAQHLDTLTALPTRWQLHKDIEALQQGRLPFYIMKLDLNKFHLVNDVYGHTTGDILLQTVAWRLAQQLEANDKLYRQNGDEFWLLLHTASAEKVNKLAEQLLFQLSQHSDSFLTDINLTASVGISSPMDHNEQAETLLQQVDIALHEAKKANGYQIRCYNSVMQTDISKRYQLQQSIKQALQQQAFYPLYQPIVNSAGRLCSIELLTRWHHPSQGFISPDIFIPMLEEDGLITFLTAQMLKLGIAQLAKWRQTMPQLRLSVNFSAPDIANPELVSQLSTLLALHGLPAQALIVEITESILIEQSETVMAQLANLKQLGVAIALDDFGTGYSSLSYLDRYPVDILKIDRSFINKLGDPKARRLTLAIIHLANELNLFITAEGVEHPQQLVLLQQESCHYFQGFYFSKPLLPAQLEQTTWFVSGQTLPD